MTEKNSNNESYDTIIKRFFKGDNWTEAEKLANKYIANQLRKLADNIEQGKGLAICTAWIPKEFFLKDFSEGPFIECEITLSHPWGG